MAKATKKPDFEVTLNELIDAARQEGEILAFPNMGNAAMDHAITRTNKLKKLILRLYETEKRPIL